MIDLKRLVGEPARLKPRWKVSESPEFLIVARSGSTVDLPGAHVLKHTGARYFSGSAPSWAK
jgi:hypothetical protein